MSRNFQLGGPINLWERIIGGNFDIYLRCMAKTSYLEAEENEIF
jgi:hypothetical protein